MNWLNCESKQRQPKQSEVAQVLKESSEKTVRSSYSGRSDLVAELYEEAAKQNEDLKEFDDLVRELSASKSAELGKQKDFQNKNESYYSSAHVYTSRIKNGKIKQRLKLIIEGSKNRYLADVRDLQELIAEVDSLAVVADDFGFLVKVVATLPLIESYQKTDKPASEQLKKLIKDYKGVFEKAETIIRDSKNK